MAEKWIQAMHMKEGAATASAKRAGESLGEWSQEHKHEGGKAGHRARLAITLRHLAKRKGQAKAVSK